MKRFLKKVFVTTLSLFLSFALLIGFGLRIIASKSKALPTKLDKNTVLHIPLHGVVVEHNPKSRLQVLEQGNKAWIDLVALKRSIQMAQTDERIQGIYLEMGDLVAGWASLEAIRSSLQTFKATGKFIIAYGENYSNKTYYLASLADDIVLHPAGNFFFNGLNLTVFFYKDLLDKLGVIPEVFRVGKYKSAVEPFTNYSMSEASKQQSSILLHGIYEHMLQQIAVARGLTVDKLKYIAKNIAELYPQGVYQAALITKVGHFDEVESLINHKMDLPAADKVHYINFDRYAHEQKIKPKVKTKIAVLVASGVIVDEPSRGVNISSKKFVKDLKALREDPDIKAIVLRINSPGGSALASETMWKELMLTRAVKPVVASMGDVAASGGYYIATACQPIIAHPTTITGSIGIYGLYFNTEALLKDKIGITRDGIKTSPSADLLQVSRPLSAYEKFAIQKNVARGYDLFLERVADGRNMQKSLAASLAEGRVWSGELAYKHGLVDELGGLAQAIQKAAELAGIAKAYQVSYWPKPKTWLEELLYEWQDMSNNRLQNLIVKLAKLLLNQTDIDVDAIQELKAMQGIQTRMPYQITID